MKGPPVKQSIQSRMNAIGQNGNRFDGQKEISNVLGFGFAEGLGSQIGFVAGIVGYASVCKLKIRELSN